MDEDFKQLVAKRGQIKARLTRFIKFVEVNTDDPPSIETTIQFKERLRKVENDYLEFIKLQEQIELIDHDKDSTDKHNQEWETFENNYYNATASAIKYINENDTKFKDTKPDISCTHEQAQRRHQCNISIPPMPLPRFDGQYEEYESFKQMFTSAVDSNKELSDVQRLYYLKQTVSSEAEQIIKHIELVAKNYQIAWELLDERFENKKLVVQSHVRSLFNLPKLEIESHTALRSLCVDFKRHLRILESLHQPVDQCDFLLTHLIASKLDVNTQNEWEKVAPRKELPSLSLLMSFLDDRCISLEAMERNRSNAKNMPTTSAKGHKIQQYPLKYNDSYHSSKSPQTNLSRAELCALCQSQHKIFACHLFLQLTPQRRRNETIRLNLCTNCLKPGHKANSCQSSSCKVCNSKHNTLLHVDAVRPKSPNNNSRQESQHGPPEQTESVKTTSYHAGDQQITSYTKEILLATAIVNICSTDGRTVAARALLDQGSQVNFISNSLVKQLKLKKTNSFTEIYGVNSAKTSANFKVSANIHSRINDYNSSLDFLILPKITQHIPKVKIDLQNINLPSQLMLADPNFYEPGKIDLLLGAEIFFDLLNPGNIRLNTPSPVILQDTTLGWVVSGAIWQPSQSFITATTFSKTNQEECMQKAIELFWLTEEPHPKTAFSGEDYICERHYKNNYRITPTGRFIVSLPTKANLQQLGDSRSIALRRFYQLEKRLSKQTEIKQQYCSFMDEYIKLGHMKLITEREVLALPQPHYYIPHHPVLKPSSTTTKLRVVFNASSPSSSGLSLNDCLMVRPVVQDDLFSIVVRFRKHNYVISTDAEKMYRQVLIDPQQIQLQLIFWRDNTDKPVEVYGLQTVTYGTACAPYLATKTLQQLAIESQSCFPLGAVAVKNDFYVDDGLTGANTLEETLSLQQELISLFHNAGFHLRKWASNHVALLNHIPLQDRELQTSLQFDQDHATIKTLGLLWNPSTDSFHYSYNLRTNQNPLTKRMLLSELFTIFDPLGLIGPIIFTIKVVIQNIWKTNINWDNPVPDDITSTWLNIKTSLPLLNDLQIPRQITIHASIIDIQLHGFCDASELGFGACLYLRCETTNGSVSVKLICSKGRVAPLKQQTLPRLELNGAVLLAELAHRVKEALKLKLTRTLYWTDSTIVLCWLAAPSTNWNTFVANRISTIQSLSDYNDWRHVSTKDNPADLASRGATPRYLIESELWWSGPPWLEQAERYWPIKSLWESSHSDEVLERKRSLRNQTCFFAEIREPELISNYSSYTKLIRIVAYILRFYINAQLPASERLKGRLSTHDLLVAKIQLTKLIQATFFGQELKELQVKQQITHKQSKLISLYRFIDSNGIIRVGGRLSKADLPPDVKHPSVLPKESFFSTLIIRHFHQINLHSGCLATLNLIRQEFWILGAKNLTKRIIRDCITCFKANPQSAQQLMGDLPKHRISTARAFINTGVDYCGPVNILSSHRRGAKTNKGYIAIFICLCVKAIH